MSHKHSLSQHTVKKPSLNMLNICDSGGHIRPQNTKRRHNPHNSPKSTPIAVYHVYSEIK